MRPGRGSGGGPARGDVRMRHIPVLLPEVIQSLAPRDGETYIDGTFGAGGYSRAILEAAGCRVLAFDRDPDAIAGGADLAQEFAPRLELIQAPFSEMGSVAAERGAVTATVAGVTLDLGVSSMQLDQPERGFSFQTDGPLDMRMSRAGPSAADVVNTLEEEALADLIYALGEERRSRAVARAIVARRRERPFERTLDLASVVARAVGGKRDPARHPATRTFQALRMHVNDELGELERGLEAAGRLLKPGGRLAVVSFHSLEDRIVKRFIAERTGREVRGSRHLPGPVGEPEPARFRFVNTPQLTPHKGELDVNRRARSARLRAAERTDAPWSPVR